MSLTVFRTSSAMNSMNFKKEKTGGLELVSSESHRNTRICRLHLISMNFVNVAQVKK